jgi:sarcosine oxidase subunit delta
MRIPCPYCGPRDSSEFAYHGDAAPRRPADGDAAAMADYVYLRDNPAGPIEELWYHAQGCRSWLVVSRDTRDHAIAGARLAARGAAA